MITGRGGKISLEELIKMEESGSVITTGWGVPPDNKLGDDVPPKLIKAWRQRINIENKLTREIQKARLILKSKEMYDDGSIEDGTGNSGQNAGRTQETAGDGNGEIGAANDTPASPARTRQLGRRASS